MSDKIIAPPKISAVVLAGGQARRMGGSDKGLLNVAGRAMIDWTLERVRGQVDCVMINANRSADEYQQFGERVIGDSLGGFQGPLAGLQSAFAHAEHDLLLCVPCDAPLVPRDLVQRLFEAMDSSGEPIAVAEAQGRLHSLHALFRTSLAVDLDQALSAGERKPDRWYAACGFAKVQFDDDPAAFANINTPEQLEQLEARLNQEQA